MKLFTFAVKCFLGNLFSSVFVGRNVINFTVYVGRHRLRMDYLIPNEYFYLAMKSHCKRMRGYEFFC